MPMMATKIRAPKIPSMIKTVFLVPDIVKSSVLMGFAIHPICEYAGAWEKV